MPVPEPSYTDRELLARVQELLGSVVRSYAAERRRNLTPEQFELQMSTTTIAITEVLARGQFSYIITANSSMAYNVLKRNPQLLRSFEVLGDPNTNVYPKPTPEETESARSRGEPISGRITIHAEQLGAWSGQELHGSILRIAASWRVCPVCREFFSEFFPRVRLIDSSSRFPPPTPVRTSEETPSPSEEVPAPSPGLAGAGTSYSAGQRATAALVLIIQGVSYFLERYVATRETARVREAVRAKESFIKTFQDQNPSMGVLVHIYFENGIFLPPLDFSYGSTFREASESYVSARPPDVTTLWRKPLTPQQFVDLQPPFRRVALATFSSRMVFQDVEFKMVGGFDEAGESVPLFPSPSFRARFWILEPPPVVTVFWYGRWTSKDVALAVRRLASGQSVRCIDLDSGFWSIGNDSAFMAFPADEATAKWFLIAKETWDPYHTLQRYDLQYVRWISPERAKLLAPQE